MHGSCDAATSVWHMIPVYIRLRSSCLSRSDFGSQSFLMQAPSGPEEFPVAEVAGPPRPRCAKRHCNAPLDIGSADGDWCRVCTMLWVLHRECSLIDRQSTAAISIEKLLDPTCAWTWRGAKTLSRPSSTEIRRSTWPTEFHHEVHEEVQCCLEGQGHENDERADEGVLEC